MARVRYGHCRYCGHAFADDDIMIDIETGEELCSGCLAPDFKFYE